jgi:hypothetical protein
MPNEQTTLLKVAVPGAIAIGPFRAGFVYPVPSDAVALLGDRFGPPAKDDKLTPADLTAEHRQMIDEHRTRKRAADEADAKAKAEAAVAAAPSTPAVAGNVTGV